MKALVEAYRSAVARGELALKRSVWSKTGSTNVILIKGKFQARLQVPGDGRGGTQKRKQYSLPGLFDTAEDAAKKTRAPTVYGRQTVQIMPCRAFWPTTRTQD